MRLLEASVDERILKTNETLKVRFATNKTVVDIAEWTRYVNMSLSIYLQQKFKRLMLLLLDGTFTTPLLN